MKAIVFAVTLIFMISVPTNVFANNPGIDVIAPWYGNGDTLSVVIVNKANLDENKIAIIKKVIESDTAYSNADQIFYEGWRGALKSIDSKIVQFEITVSQKARTGDIIIELLTEINPSYNGYTTQNYAYDKITHAQIQIYDSENITNAHLENLVRHEFGHALGIGHSDNQSAIMYAFMTEDPKFITPCDLAGLKVLEEGKVRTSINCV